MCTTTLLMDRIGRHPRDRVFRVRIAAATYDDASARRLGLLYILSYSTVRLHLAYSHRTQTHLFRRHFLTSSYDGHIRLFDYAQKLVQDVPAHQAPITDVCVVPSPAATDESVLIATASHDLTASLTRVSLVPDASLSSQTLASLHLHTSPLSSISSDHTGSHLLTASWDHLIGFWDTTIPTRDEVARTSDPASSDRKKRRKIAGEADDARGKRKAPMTILKSHTARVSKAVFAPESNQRAYSCGFDSTVRTWDVESGVCMDTVVRLSSFFFVFN